MPCSPPLGLEVGRGPRSASAASPSSQDALLLEPLEERGEVAGLPEGKAGGDLLWRRRALWDGPEEKFRAGFLQSAPRGVAIGTVVPALSGDPQEAQAAAERNVHARIVAECAHADCEVRGERGRGLHRTVVGGGCAVRRRDPHRVVTRRGGRSETDKDIADDRRSTCGGLPAPVADPLAEWAEASARGVGADGAL